jgi:hypothetical protein
VNEHEKIRIIPKTFSASILYDGQNLITGIRLTRLQRRLLAPSARRREFQIISAPASVRDLSAAVLGKNTPVTFSAPGGALYCCMCFDCMT